jgi:hypothetical protein
MSKPLTSHRIAICCAINHGNSNLPLSLSLSHFFSKIAASVFTYLRNFRLQSYRKSFKDSVHGESEGETSKAGIGVDALFTMIPMTQKCDVFI